MTLEEILETRKRSAVAVFHRFRLEVRTRVPQNIFIEGFDDVLFYSKLTRTGELRNALLRLTYGKRNMDRIIEWFYAEGFADTDTLFIRDSDFDRFLGCLPTGDHVFSTCGYAVENYVCAREALRRYFLENFCVDPVEVNVDGFIDLFESSTRSLFEWMAPLIGRILREVRNGLILNLQALDLRGEFRSLLQGLELGDIYDKDFLAIGIVLDHEEPTLEEGSRYTAQDPISWIRGKQLIQNASVFLREASDDLRKQLKQNEITQFRKAASQDFSEGAVFERLASFASGTAALRSALKAA
jgi:hypothetical protein